MKKSFKGFLKVFKTAFKAWWAKDPFKESAVIAYYAIFSLPGLLIVFVTIAGYFFGKDAVNLKIAEEFTSTMGIDTSKQIEEIITKGMASKNSLWATIFGIFTILLGATGVFTQFQKSLNTIWEVEVNLKTGIWYFVKVRIFSFGILMASTFILVVSLVVSAILSAFGTWVTGYFSESFLFVLLVGNIILSLSILASLFALMFKFIPDALIKWRHVWIGALVTAILFETGKTALGFYFGTANPGSGYGVAGSIILILLWVSYTTMIVFYGAEFTHAYAKMRDGRIKPDKIATMIPKAKL